VNSRRKGKRGEREFAALLREHGFNARRGQQFSGSPDSPDVVSPALAWLHIEVKRVQNLNLADACAQAERDQTGSGLNAAGAAKPKKLAWIVAHRRNHAPWLITMKADFFFKLLRGEFFNLDSLAPARSALTGPSPAANSLFRLPGETNLRGVLPPEDEPKPTTKRD
jgi:hypothetical protein